jgi:hypothetical protein
MRLENKGALAKEINDGGGTAHFIELDIINQDQ